MLECENCRNCEHCAAFHDSKSWQMLVRACEDCIDCVQCRDTRTAADNIHKLAHMGTVPPAPILNIVDALDFHLSIGSRNKEARLRYLSQYWLVKVRGLPGVQVLTPRDPARSCAIAVFRIQGIPSSQVAQRLMAEYKVFTVVRCIEIDGVDGVRVTPHLYTRLQDLDSLVAGICQICAGAAA